MNDVPAPARRGFVRFIPHILRVLLALPLLLAGSNGLFHYLPEPKPELPAGAMAFAGALVQSGYMMPLIATTQLVVALLLLANRFVPLALVLLAPFLLNALLFHAVLERGGLPIVLVFVAVELYLAWCWRAAYRPLLTARHTPA